MNTTRRSFLVGLGAVVVAPKVSLPEIPFNLTATEVTERISGFAMPVNEHLIRSQIWSKQLKEILLDELTSIKASGIIRDD